MKNYLRPYAEPARVALSAIVGLLVAFGLLTAGNAAIVIGAALAFGVAFWKWHDKGLDSNPTESAKIMLACISAILLAFGYVDANTVATMTGTATAIVATLWTVFSAYKK